MRTKPARPSRSGFAQDVFERRGGRVASLRPDLRSDGMIQSAIQSALPAVIERLRNEFDPVAIYHFGSSARGSAGPDSDLDLVVVLADSAEPFLDRSVRAYRALRPLGLPVDVQVYTRDEFDARASLVVSFERTVREEGRLIYVA